MKKITLGILVLAILSVAGFAVPNQLTYSGRLLQNGALVNSTMPMIFSIHTDPTAGTQLWSQSITSVEVNQGIYSVILGEAGNPISPNVFVTDNAYLQVVVNGETLSPRTKINSVGYALQAGGLSNGGVQAVTVSTNGNVGIGTTAPGSKLSVKQISDPNLGGESSESLRVYNAAGTSFAQLQVNNKGAELSSSGPAGGVFLPLFINTSRAGIPPITVSQNGCVGIGTTNPGFQLDASSSIASREQFVINGGNNRIVNGYGDAGINWTTSGQYPDIFFRTNSTERMRVTNGGNLGINITYPQEKLDVRGNTFVSVGEDIGVRKLVLYHGRSNANSYYRITLPETYSGRNGGSVKVKVTWLAAHAIHSEHQEYQFTYGTHHNLPDNGFLLVSPVTTLYKDKTADSYSYYYDQPADVEFYKDIVEDANGYTGVILKVKGYHVSYANCVLIEAEINGQTTAPPTLAYIGTSLPSGAEAMTKTTTGWIAIPSGAGWTSSAYCRRIGSTIQFKGHFQYSSSQSWWGASGIIIPAECRPAIDIVYAPASFWGAGSASASFGFAGITTAGVISLYTNSPTQYFSITGAYPAD
ncbi:MAG: hypothetical protein WC838_02935 [Candidatus Margulisiibacteriota bacterium]|jgi:hypothetical protein